MSHQVPAAFHKSTLFPCTPGKCEKLAHETHQCVLGVKAPIPKEKRSQLHTGCLLQLYWSGPENKCGENGWPWVHHGKYLVFQHHWGQPWIPMSNAGVLWGIPGPAESPHWTTHLVATEIWGEVPGPPECGLEGPQKRLPPTPTQQAQTGHNYQTEGEVVFLKETVVYGLLFPFLYSFLVLGQHSAVLRSKPHQVWLQNQK